MAGDQTATLLFFASLFLIGFALLAARRGRSLAAALSALITIFFMAGMRSILRASLLEPYYQPSMRPVESGPLILFLAALAVSVLIIVRLVAVYRRQAMLPMLEDAESAQPATEPDRCGAPAEEPPLPVRTGTPDRARAHDAMLVNEIAMGRMDNDEQAEADPEPDARPFGGKRP